MYNRIALKEY